MYRVKLHSVFGVNESLQGRSGPVVDIEIEDIKEIGNLIQKINIEIDAQTMIPIVTLTLIPGQLDVLMDRLMKINLKDATTGRGVTWDQWPRSIDDYAGYG